MAALIAIGASAFLPSIGVLVLNGIGFAVSGIAGGSLAATFVYGDLTTGVSSVLQSVGATAVVAAPLVIWLGVAAIGRGLLTLQSHADHMAVLALPPFPSARSRKTLSASQLAELNKKICSVLQQILPLPSQQRDTLASKAFVATYAQDTARQTLDHLIWGTSSEVSSQFEKLIKKYTLDLAEKLASSNVGLDADILIDLAVVYANTNISQLRTIFEAAGPSSLVSTVESEVVPAFTTILSATSPGLYNLRKSCHCICSFLQASGLSFVHRFSINKEFIGALARTYYQGLTSVAQTYGGLSSLQRAESRELDEWERMWIECKVALMDSFHAVVKAWLRDLSNMAPAENERSFSVIFGLLEESSSPSSSESLPPTPFLNQPLLADYQHAYNLSRALTDALGHLPEQDVRVDVLQSMLNSFETHDKSGPGVLKLLLRSSGIVTGPPVDHKGKGKAIVIPVDPDLDIKVTQVLDILPDYPRDYIRALLSETSYPFTGNPEKVIEALLEGTAPSEGELASQTAPQAGTVIDEFSQYVKQRRNVFDGEQMDVSQLRIGKKKDDEATIIQDRAFIEQIKADILRRAEAISDDELDQENFPSVLDEPELDSGVNVAGDGEESGEEEQPAVPSNDTLLELAYIRNPKLFDRDANTRRSKERAELKSQTNLADEQIEGWRIMLEKNPNKEKILQKHEFSGNQPTLSNHPSSSADPGRGHGARGRGRGRGRGQDRAWKDKNKASMGNHDRKRGHDKKMARVAGPST